MRFFSVTSVPQTLHTLVRVATAVPPPPLSAELAPGPEEETDEQVQRRPSALPAAPARTPLQTGQIINVDMRTSLGGRHKVQMRRIARRAPVRPTTREQPRWRVRRPARLRCRERSEDGEPPRRTC